MLEPVRVIPMFPLGAVLLPGEPLALQVFEPRYLRLLRDCLDATIAPEFGVVLIERGHEVGGGDQRAGIGTLARIETAEALPGNRFRLACRGGERIRVLGWLPDDPYPRAEVEPWPDRPADDTRQFARVRENLAAVVGLAGELAAAGRSATVPADLLAGLPAEPSARSFAVAARSPIGESDRYAALCAPDPAARLDRVAVALDDLAAVLRFRLQ